MHRGPITSVLSTQQDQIVYTGGYDRCIYKWNRQQEKERLLEVTSISLTLYLFLKTESI